MAENSEELLSKQITDDEVIDLDLFSLSEDIKSHITLSDKIIRELKQLQEEISAHRRNVLKAKTSGTTAAATGTTLAITGLIMAPFTLGASLIVSSIGAVTSVGGALTNMITDLVDGSKRKTYLHNIQTISEDFQATKTQLTQKLKFLEQIMNPLMEQGLSKFEALYVSLVQGDRADIDNNEDINKSKEDDEEFEIVETPGWKPVKKFAFNATIHSLKLIKNSQTLSTLAVAGGNGASAAAAANASVHVGRIIGTTVLKTTLATVGVVFTSIDVALLVKQWKAKDPTLETVEFVVDELEQEVKQYEELYEMLEKVEKCGCFKILINDNLMVVGSSPFAVRCLEGIVNRDEGKVTKKLYGVQNEENVYNWAHYWVGPEFPPSADEIIISEKEKELECLSKIEDIFDYFISNSHPNQNVDDDDNDQCLQVQVVDPRILNLYSGLIDLFLTSNRLPKFSELLQKLTSLKSATIVKDYFNPLPENTKMIIQNVLIAYIKLGNPTTIKNRGYVNANKWEYDLLFQLLQTEAIKYFSHEYLNLSVDNDDSVKFKDFDLENYLESMINHKSFADPVASLVWAGEFKHSEKQKSLENVFKEIESLLRNLRFKIPLWACEISEVIK